jgi:hypothetical protein
VQAAEKESVILECEVDEEDAKVVWKKDGEVFKPADKKSDNNQLLSCFKLFTGYFKRVIRILIESKSKLRVENAAFSSRKFGWQKRAIILVILTLMRLNLKSRLIVSY